MDYAASAGKMDMILNKLAVACLKVLFQNLPGGPKETHENLGQNG
jgi:hypothetical protein